MRSSVTVIPEDHFISVDGTGYFLDFSAPDNLHAVQWHDGKGHCEWTDRGNSVITSYDEEVQPYVAAWEAEYTRLQAQEQAEQAPERVAERECRVALQEQLTYLSDTDWYVVRYEETGVAIPAEVTAARAAARTAIDELRAQLDNLAPMAS